MITVPSRHKQPVRGANRPLDVAVTVNFNAEFHLMVVNPIIECVSWDLIPKDCHGLECSVVYNAPPFCVESLRSRSNSRLPRLPFHRYADGIIPALKSNISI
jgi:hypothetical protein